MYTHFGLVILVWSTRAPPYFPVICVLHTSSGIPHARHLATPPTLWIDVTGFRYTFLCLVLTCRALLWCFVSCSLITQFFHRSTHPLTHALGFYMSLSGVLWSSFLPFFHLSLFSYKGHVQVPFPFSLLRCVLHMCFGVPHARYSLVSLATLVWSLWTAGT